MAYRIPHSYPTDSKHGEKDDDDIPEMDAHRIGIDDERTAAATQTDKAKGLLEPAEEQSEQDADQCPGGSYHPALKEEDG